MLRIKPATRIALTLGFISATLVWIAHGLNLVPDPYSASQEKNTAIVQTLAASITTLAANNVAPASLQNNLDLTARLNKDIQSLAVRRKSNYFARTSNHQQNWKPVGKKPRLTQAELEIRSNKRLWGTLEVCFVDERPLGIFGFMFPLGLATFIGGLTSAFSWFVLHQSFRYLNPSRVVPKRVRSAFDTLTEGVVLVDPNCEIAHANLAFGRIHDREPESLIGVSVNELGWKAVEGNVGGAEVPWVTCVANESPVTGQILEFGENETHKRFVVNSAPIFATDGKCRGAMISFDDVTAMEQQKSELADLVKTLRSSRDEVKRQNEQLTFLASYDPLTQCMNRRAFWTAFGQLWTDTKAHELSLMIIDVDHFKSINDTYGHSFGDQVLTVLGEALRNSVSQQGIVCRFGGEEFVVALSGLALDAALEMTNNIHQAIQALNIEGRQFTASIGFTNRAYVAMDGQHMLDQADLALYQAKRTGRNRIVRFDECDTKEKVEGQLQVAENSGDLQSSDERIPRDAVAGLLSALAQRCESTADHSARVAELAVAVGADFLNPTELERLEVVATLHEIGKLTAPESIFTKSSLVSDADRRVVSRHNKVGLQLVRSAIDDPEIAEIIKTYQLITEVDPWEPAYGEGDSVVESILAIVMVCDAFDGLTNGSIYRKGLSASTAIEKIQIDTPMRYRPDVVSTLSEYVATLPEATDIADPVGTSKDTISMELVNELLNLREEVKSTIFGEEVKSTTTTGDDPLA